MLVAAALLGCGPADPDAELAALVGEAEAAAEARDWRFFSAHVGEAYIDAAGRRREDVVALLRGYFVTHQTVHIALQLESVERVAEDVAELSLVAGLLGTRGDSMLSGADGDIYRLELELVRGDDAWQIIGARWHRSLGYGP